MHVPVQAVHHLRQSADLTKVVEEKGNSLHLLGGALKDLKRLDEAEQVRPSHWLKKVFLVWVVVD